MKKRSILAKRYHSNSIANNKEALDIHAKACTLHARYIAKMSSKLHNAKTNPKTYWLIINKFLSNKKLLLLPLVLVNGELVSGFKQKAGFSYKTGKN